MSNNKLDSDSDVMSVSDTDTLLQVCLIHLDSLLFLRASALVISILLLCMVPQRHSCARFILSFMLKCPKLNMDWLDYSFIYSQVFKRVERVVFFLH